MRAVRDRSSGPKCRRDRNRFGNLLFGGALLSGSLRVNRNAVVVAMKKRGPRHLISW